MKILRTTFVATMLLLGTGIGGVSGQVAAQGWTPELGSSVTISVERGVEAEAIAKSALQIGPPAGCVVKDIILESPPLHGILLEEPDRFVYQPGLDFWTSGTDRLIYSVRYGSYCSPLSQTFFLNLVTAKFTGSPTFSEGFETGDPDLPPIEGPGASINRSQEAAISGTWGLSVVAAPGAQAYQPFLGDLKIGGNQGGEIRMELEPPVLPLAGDESNFLIYALVPVTGGRPFLRLRMNQTSIETLLRTETWNDGIQDWNEGAWFKLSPNSHTIVLDYWRANAHRGAGVGFWLDGALREELRWTPPRDPSDSLEHRFGAMEIESDYALDFPMDSLCLVEHVLADTFVVLAADGFEGGALNQQPGSNPIVSHPGAAITGEGGLEVAVVASHPDGAYLLDEAPFDENDYGVRFDFDTSLLTLQPWEGVTLVAGSGTQAPTLGQEAVKLRLRATPTGFQVRAVARLNTGSSQGALRFTDWIPFSRGVHTLSLHWRAAPEGSALGRLRLWLGDTLAAEELGLDNSQWRVQSLWLGARKADPGASGFLHYDNFQAWKNL
ncbi:MAG: hypothetical protein K0U98_15240 [Deltaproteobacteria bacterium]|nr:hypothetical protein [Deltaproteobacteria bacterium]